MNEIDKRNSDRSVKIYEKAADAFNKNSYDYAINLLLSVIEISPNFVKARHLLRLIQKKKLEKSGFILLARLIGNILSLPNYIMGLTLYSKKIYPKAMMEFEKILCKDPANTIILRSLADCSAQLGMTETTIDIYESLITINPSSVKDLEKIASIYMREANNLDRAKDCYAQILQYDKTNHNARKGLSDVAALQTIKVANYDDLTSSFLKKVKDADYADITEKKLRAVKSEEDLQILIKDTLEKQRKEPKNVKILIELAGYYLQAKEYNLAVRYYQKARNLTPEDYTLTKFIMEAETLKLDETILQLIKHKEVDPESEKVIIEIQELKTQTVFKHLKEMIAQRPNDRELRYQLGRLYFDQNMIDEAIKEFQFAVNEPRFKLSSYNLLGLCFSSKKMYDIAEVQFVTALSELAKVGGTDNFKKELIYNLAATYENMGKKGEAVERYKEIYKIDISFKDVAQKMNKLYSK